MKPADFIRIEQEKLDAIRDEAERKTLEFINEEKAHLKAQSDAKREKITDAQKIRDHAAGLQEKLGGIKEQQEKRAEQRGREDRHAEEQRKSDDQKADEQRKADQQKRDDQQKEDHRAEARAHAREETERLVKEELEKHVRESREVIMAGSSRGPAMTPGMNDPIRMAAAMDHPGLTDDQKLILHNYGYAVGEGWHNREETRKNELMQGERQKRADAKSDLQQRGGIVGKDDDFFADLYSKDAKDLENTPAQTVQSAAVQDQDKTSEQQHADFFEKHFREDRQDRDRTPEQKAAEAVQARDDAISDVKEDLRKDHEDQQVGETGKDVKERADLESTGKVSVKEAEEMTHGKGSHEKADQRFEEWYERHEDKALEEAGVSRDPHDYEIELEDER